jgi:hypothetical protein
MVAPKKEAMEYLLGRNFFLEKYKEGMKKLARHPIVAF